MNGSLCSALSHDVACTCFIPFSFINFITYLQKRTIVLFPCSGRTQKERWRLFFCFWFAAPAISVFCCGAFSALNFGGSFPQITASFSYKPEEKKYPIRSCEWNQYHMGLPAKETIIEVTGPLCTFGFPEEDRLTWIKMLHMVSDGRASTASFFQKSKQSAPWNGKMLQNMIHAGSIQTAVRIIGP